MKNSRFSDKDEMFGELVSEGAELLFAYFQGVQDEFASFAPERQREEMHSYVERKVDRMIDIIYDHSRWRPEIPCALLRC